MNTSLSIFARGLASENLSFSFDANAETASFDVKGRHLTMPVWNVSETVQTMLVAHEISHALWTPYERSTELLAAAEQEGYNLPLLQRIANVIEDVRIEKKMKDKFPGTRRDFFLGYKEIIDLDLFKFKQMDMAKARFLNRLNIHYKWGVPGFFPVQFGTEEQEIVQMVDRVETFDQVMELAKYLYRHPSMKDMRDKVEQMAKQNGEGEDEIKQMLSKEVADGEGIGKKDGEEYHATNITIVPLKDVKQGIINTDILLKKFDETYNGYGERVLDLTEYRSFVKDSDAFVRQLVAQFERKKAADEIRRERPKQTGTLNLDKLHQYRTHDDIFLSKIVKQEGKNHGIMFMLDMSGSMGHNIGDCFLQILQLVWFCDKAKIPFEVFGFTDVHAHSYDDDYTKKYDAWRKANPNAMSYEYESEAVNIASRKVVNGMEYGAARLINLASSRDDAAKRERLLAYIYMAYVSKNGGPRPQCVTLSGTPTVESVAIASQFMQGWVTDNNIQIPTIMVVTDGSPNGICTVGSKNTEWRVMPQHTITVQNEILGTVTRVDGSEMFGLDMSNAIIATMLNGLRTKLNARCVGMFVGSNNLTEREYVAFCMSRKEVDEFYRSSSRDHELTTTARFKAAKEAYADGCVLVHPDVFPGYDAYFLTRTPKIVKDEDAIAETGTFTKVKNQFIKTMGKKAGSRVFLTRYVDIVAGQPINKGVDAIYSQSTYPEGFVGTPKQARKPVI